MFTLDQAWDILKQLGVHEQTIQTVTAINGYTMKSLCDILYVNTGYRNFEQLADSGELDYLL